MGAVGCSRREVLLTPPGVADDAAKTPPPPQGPGAVGVIAAVDRDAVASACKEQVAAVDWTSFLAGDSALVPCAEEALAIEKVQCNNAARLDEALVAVFGEKAKLAQLVSLPGKQGSTPRLLAVVDGVVSEELRSHLERSLQGEPVRRSEFARHDTRQHRHHVIEHCLEHFLETEICSLVDRLTHMLFSRRGGRPLELYRAYTNCVLYGDVAFVHKDSTCPDDVTAIIYSNLSWSPELAGETMFYDGAGEIVAAVQPRPGRIALFHANIMHKGSPPSRLSWGTRYTTAMKLAPAESIAQHDYGRSDR